MIIKQRKVFCIGFNKTGTSSLHYFFEDCGLKSSHNDQWPHYTKVHSGKRYFRHQCYSDGEQSDFVALDRWFPNSLFIFNTRNEKDWLYSRVKHVLRYNENIDVNEILSSPKYGTMAKEFFADENNAITKWISERRVYTKKAKSYFHEKPNFLEIDITQDKDWVKKLLHFFKENRFRISSKGSGDTIHENKRSKNDLTNQELLQKYMKLVDEKLELLT